ncbi:MAG: DUF366 family protein [Bdellovibrio sp.]|jgi:hypothetical protein
MKTHFDSKNLKYDGTQLRALRNYLEYGLLGDSVLAWIGPCQISLEHMVDGEDLREQAKIEGSEMIHFIFEVFDVPLVAGVCLQRLMADHVRALILEKTKGKTALTRQGDDLYFDSKKLSISIATKSVNSVLVHFALNVRNDGTPVSTCALSDFALEAVPFAQEACIRIAEEWVSIKDATWKIRAV